MGVTILEKPLLGDDLAVAIRAAIERAVSTTLSKNGSGS
jgi:hypothetical protein